MKPKGKKRTFIVQFNVNCYATTELRVSAATLKDAEQKALARLNKADFGLQLLNTVEQSGNIGATLSKAVGRQRPQRK